MRYFLLLALLCAPLASQATPPIHLALVPGADERGVPGELAGYARTTLEEELLRSGRFTLVERQRVEQVVEEIAFQQSGVTESSGAAELGRLLNVDKLAFVQVHRLHPDYQLTVRLVDVSTGQLLRVEKQGLGRQQDQIRAAVRRLAQRLAAVASLLSPEDMVLLPAGAFPMGSATGLSDEQPIHCVSIDSFYLDRYEVSRIAFQEFLVSRGKQREIDPRDPDLPAAEVSWHEATAYCQARDKRLPTEAEWEYAARGTAGRSYPWGEATPMAGLARFAAGAPLPIDSLPQGATPEGIHHLSGNVAEWVQDWWNPTYYGTSPAANPTGPPEGDFRTVRGGAWSGPAEELRATARAYHNPERGAAHIGFRCVRDARP